MILSKAIILEGFIIRIKKRNKKYIFVIRFRDTNMCFLNNPINVKRFQDTKLMCFKNNPIAKIYKIDNCNVIKI